MLFSKNARQSLPDSQKRRSAKHSATIFREAHSKRRRRPPRPRGQCPRGSWLRFAEQLPGSRAAGWRLRAKAGCNPYYVEPNITWIMLPADLCDVRHRLADRQRFQLHRTSHKLVRVERETSAGQDCPASVFAVAAAWFHTCPTPSPSSPDRFPHRCSWCRWRHDPAMLGSC